ncbi:MAG: methionyl-tRNA formyltransferase, partial [Oscillospiraceae bacterium]|nr:methionyl-tRNA formyltransferase [Oscillospiraceae bacterium]
LLPKDRGAAPIHWSILNGERENGVTIMYMAEALDAGDIIAQVSTPIDPNENAGELTARLAKLGGELLVKTVKTIEDGTATGQAQEESLVTLAPMLSKELSPLDFTRSAQALHDQVRGLFPWPMAVAQLKEVRCKVFVTQVEELSGHPGTVLEAGNEGLLVACGQGSLRIIELQPDGGKRMQAAAYLLGHPLQAGEVL